MAVNNSINKSNPNGEARPLRRLSTMTVVVGHGKKRKVFERPLDDAGRESMANEIKKGMGL